MTLVEYASDTKQKTTRTKQNIFSQTASCDASNHRERIAQEVFCMQQLPLSKFLEQKACPSSKSRLPELSMTERDDRLPKAFYRLDMCLCDWSGQRFAGFSVAPIYLCMKAFRFVFVFSHEPRESGSVCITIYQIGAYNKVAPVHLLA